MPCPSITFTKTDARAAPLLFTVLYKWAPECFLSHQVTEQQWAPECFLSHQATEQQWWPDCFLSHQATEPDRSAAEHVKLRSPP